MKIKFAYGIAATVLCIVIYVLLFLTASAPEKTIRLPFKKVRIGVLSKYGLRQLSMHIKNGRLFINGNTYALQDETIFIQIDKSTIAVSVLSVSSKKMKYTTNHLILESNASILVAWKEQQSRRFSGSLEVDIIHNKLNLINETDVESYISSTAHGELGSLVGKLKDEAHKQTLLRTIKVAIRSYLFHNQNRHKDENFHLCDLTHCMYFPGMLKKTEPGDFPVEVLLKDDNEILSAYFHSTCGSNLTGPDVYWKNHSSEKYYRQGKDSLFLGNEMLCEDSPHYRWEAVISKPKINEILGTKITGKVQLNVENGRVSSLIYFDENRIQQKISISSFLSKAGRNLGWNRIKSNDFTMEQNASFYIIRGKGLGHGVGMCQWGAMRQASMGKTYDEILEFYFPNARLVTGTY
ncbi:MAG: SpoIID/LytB domain-containing protein [Leptospirales bacterium]